MLVKGKMNNMVKFGKKKTRWKFSLEFWNFIYFAENSFWRRKMVPCQNITL